jgi:hypothetical protein
MSWVGARGVYSPDRPLSTNAARQLPLLDVCTFALAIGLDGAAQGMSEIRKWLEAIGLGGYGDAFEANKIDMDLLGQVDDQILRDM